MFFKNENKGVTLLKSGLLEAEQSLRHCFTTRLGGVSTGGCASLNTGFNRGEDREIVLRNYNLICEAAGFNFSRLSRTNQNHGIIVTEITKENVGCGFFEPSLAYTDAIVTNMTDTPIVCHTADCVPILLFDRAKQACAAIHAGWRGMVDGVIEATVKKLEELYSSDPSDMVAAIGPCICDCCFEVDEDVVETFRSAFGEGVIRNRTDGKKATVDLVKCAIDALSGCGISERNIDSAHECTKCNEELYYSHRRQGAERGTLAAIIQITGR